MRGPKKYVPLTLISWMRRGHTWYIFVYVQLSKIHVDPHKMIIKWNVLGYSCLLIQGEWTLRSKFSVLSYSLFLCMWYYNFCVTCHRRWSRWTQNQHYVYLSNIWNSQRGIKYLFYVQYWFWVCVSYSILCQCNKLIYWPQEACGKHLKRSHIHTTQHKNALSKQG